jgi:hypothetical protein
MARPRQDKCESGLNSTAFLKDGMASAGARSHKRALQTKALSGLPERRRIQRGAQEAPDHQRQRLVGLLGCDEFPGEILVSAGFALFAFGFDRCGDCGGQVFRGGFDVAIPQTQKAKNVPREHRPRILCESRFACGFELRKAAACEQFFEFCGHGRTHRSTFNAADPKVKRMLGLRAMQFS